MFSKSKFLQTSILLENPTSISWCLMCFFNLFKIDVISVSSKTWQKSIGFWETVLLYSRYSRLAELPASAAQWQHHCSHLAVCCSNLHQITCPRRQTRLNEKHHPLQVAGKKTRVGDTEMICLLKLSLVIDRLLFWRHQFGLRDIFNCSVSLH